jgi:hypothetical protein
MHELRFDRDKVFRSFRLEIGPLLARQQADRLDQLLTAAETAPPPDAFRRYNDRDVAVRQLSYVLATVYHETHHTFDLAEMAADRGGHRWTQDFVTLAMGMRRGWFTGLTLNNFINPKLLDYAQARRVFTHDMTDAEVVAEHARRFERILRAALVTSPQVGEGLTAPPPRDPQGKAA